MPIEAGQELATSQTVFRLVRRIPKFVPADRPGVSGEAFRPSSADEAEAVERGLPVRVSVWEPSITTVEQAQAFREHAVETSAYDLQVSDVQAVREMWPEATRLRVVTDPLPPSDKPGGEGHCGIEGLDRPSGADRKVFRAIWDELARRARPRS